jgi:hypothetical protein
MRYFYFVLLLAVTIISCKKSTSSSAPEIKFKKITSSFVKNTDPDTSPIITIELKDAEGDIGFNDGKDTSYVYVKNISRAPFKLDSFFFPAALAKVTGKNFKADVDIAIRSLLPATLAGPRVDTLFYEVYVKDFAKNKSNVIRTDNPLLYITP